jgi:hypothetical protein
LLFGRIAWHGIGAGIAWAVFSVQGVLVYLGLLAYALVTGADIGGPLGGPVLVLLTSVAGAVLTPLLFVPSITLGEVAGRRGGRAAGAAVTAGTAALLAAIYVAVVSAATDVTASGAVTAWLIGLLTLPGPLSAYAAVLYGGTAVLRSWKNAADRRH